MSGGMVIKERVEKLVGQGKDMEYCLVDNPLSSFMFMRLKAHRKSNSNFPWFHDMNFKLADFSALGQIL